MSDQNWFEYLSGRDKKHGDIAFTPEELAQMVAVWRRYGHHLIESHHDSVWVQIADNSHLQIQKNRVTFHGENDHEAFKAAMLHAKDAWNGEFVAHGSEDFQLKSWVYSRVYGTDLGVTMLEYMPPAHMAHQAMKLLAEVQGRRDAEKSSANTRTNPPSSQPPVHETRLKQRVTRTSRSSDYIPPRNAVDELIVACPRELLDVMLEQLKKIDEEHPTGTWPSVPYHYGMGRIKAYEDWLNSLSKEDREREIAACRERYETFNQTRAGLLADRMRELGHDIMVVRDHSDPTQQAEPAAEMTGTRKARIRRLRGDFDGPSPEPRDRSRGRSRSRSRGYER